MNVRSSERELRNEIASLRAELQQARATLSALPVNWAVSPILDALPDSVKIFDEDLQLVYANQAALDLHQAPDTDVLRRTDLAKVGPEALENVMAAHGDVVDCDAILCSHEIIGLRGRAVQVESHAVPVRLPNGRPGYMCVSHDVSARVQAEQRLRRSQERLRLIHEAADLADFEADLDKISHLSERFAAQLGLPADTTELSHRDWLELVHPADREHFLKEIEVSFASEAPHNFEFRIIRTDTDEVRWLSSCTKIERNEAGEPIRSIGAHLDVTERKLAEEEIRINAERLRLVHEATGLADFETVPGGVSVCSERYFDMCGLPVPPDRRMTFEEWLAVVHPDDRARAETEVRAAMAEKDTFSRQFRIIRADNGETRWISSHTRVQRDQSGRVLRSIGALLDITEHKRAEYALRASEERLRIVQEATGVADFVADANGLRACSDRFFEQLGLPVGDETVVGRGWAELVHPDDREGLGIEIEKAIARSEQKWLNTEFRIVRADTGQTRWISGNTKLERDENGALIRTIGGHLDVTERKEAEEALRESEERFRLAAEAAGLGVWDYDAVLRKVEWSDRFRQILGLPIDAEPDFARAQARIHPADRERIIGKFRAVRRGELNTYKTTLRIRRADDSAERWLDMNVWRTHQDSKDLKRVIITVRDVTEEKTAEQRIRWSAMHDGLTRLANRAKFQESLDHAVSEARQQGLAVGVLMLDLDHFKQLNDTLGHDVGDVLLKMIADRLRDVVRPCDTVARLGGDEFAIVVPALKSELDLTQLSRSIDARMREPFLHQGRILDCRLSSGGAIFPVHCGDTEELLKNADIALYAAKAAGRSAMTMFEPHMREDMRARATMVRNAGAAIEDDRIIPFYQPKVDLGGHAVVGFEALLRWRKPNGQMGLPADLEAAFEDLEVAAAISDRMIERVITDLRRWLDRGTEFQHVAINASAAEFRRDDFAERLLEQLRRAEVPTECFQLEVTETVFLGRGAEYVHRALALLHAHGIKIALDDFGTGYASLRHLRHFPVDIIKIDQSFVRDMETDPDDEAIVRAVINLGTSLRLEVVAEGIETASQASKLIALGCDYGQGFLFAPAIPPSRVPALIRRWSEGERNGLLLSSQERGLRAVGQR